MKVFCDGRDREVHEALRIITPEWVESGESCHQTVIDLADACRELLGDSPDVGEGWRLCSHKVAESYWDGEKWRDLGLYQTASDWYRRKSYVKGRAMGFVDVSIDLFVEMLKGFTSTDEPRMFTVADGVPPDANYDRFEVRDGGAILRVWFSSDKLPGETQFTPRLTVARNN